MYWITSLLQPLLLRDQSLGHQDIVQAQACQGWLRNPKTVNINKHQYTSSKYLRFHNDLCWNLVVSIDHVFMEDRGSLWCASNPAILSSWVHLSKTSNGVWAGLMLGTPLFFEKATTVHPKHPKTLLSEPFHGHLCPASINLSIPSAHAPIGEGTHSLTTMTSSHMSMAKMSYYEGW